MFLAVGSRFPSLFFTLPFAKSRLKRLWVLYNNKNLHLNFEYQSYQDYLSVLSLQRAYIWRINKMWGVTLCPILIDTPSLMSEFGFGESLHIVWVNTIFIYLIVPPSLKTYQLSNVIKQKWKQTVWRTPSSTNTKVEFNWVLYLRQLPVNSQPNSK